MKIKLNSFSGCFSEKVRAYLLSILLVVSITSGTKAQLPDWDTISMDASVMFMDLCVLPDGLHGWTVGSTGAAGEMLTSVVRMTDGEHWEQLPFPEGNSTILNGVCFATPDSGWVVGNSGKIFATTDGGLTWNQQSSGTSRKLSKICFINSTTGWITGGWQDGNSFLVLKTTDGGNTWQNLSFGSNCYSCLDIFFSDEMNGWICGHDSQLDPHIHHTGDGGLTWTAQTVPQGAGVPYSIDFTDNDNGWVSTSSLYLTPSGAILHTTDGGSTWNIQYYTGLPYNYCLDARDEQHIAIAAVNILQPNSEKIVVTSDGGASWNQYTPPVINYTNGLQYVGDHIWFAADYGQVLQSPDNGISWDWAYKASLYRSVAWSTPSDGWVVTASNAGVDGYCMHTTDGGETWFHDESVPGGSQVGFINENTGWMLFEGTNARIWRTTDGGDSWTQHNIPSGSAWLGNFFFINENTGWVFGSNGVIKVTHDGGSTWNNQSSGTSNYVSAVFFTDENEGWAVGGYGGANGFIRHTTDGGDSWTVQTPANDDHYQVACFTDNMTGILVAVNGKVHKTTDGGNTWEVISQLYHDYADYLIMTDELNGFLAMRNFFGGGSGEDGRGFIYRTADGGESWTLEWEGPWIKSGIGGMAFQDDDHLWACGAQNTIIVRNSPYVGFNDVSLNNPDFSVSPNPFFPETKITFNIENPGNVSINIFDVSGKLVKSLMNETKTTGKYTVYWNGKNNSDASVPNGLYFVRFNHGAKSRTQKVVKGL
jgi:photosystem II stability/assembly factor-like uncharacterized protein